MSVIRVEQLSKSFPGPRGPVHVLSNVSFTTDPNDVTVIVGPTGCGKSTLLRLIAGLDSPSAGVIHRDPALDRLSIAFQDPTLLPWRTISENVELAVSLSRGDSAAVDDALARVGLLEAATLYPHQCSGGMRARASLARAFATAPNFLVLDEPLSSVDEITRIGLQRQLSRLLDESKTRATLLVTHSLHEAALLGDRILVLAGKPAYVVREIRVTAARAWRLDNRNNVVVRGVESELLEQLDHCRDPQPVAVTELRA